ncbi:MAG: alpha-N-arabinofuranosidase [Bacteroidales bacterium]|nr:alpha-N-arabinofuranosidase [Bacteroidales bacterium]
MKRILATIAATALCLCAAAQIKVTVHESATGEPVIPAELFGQFSEHLGRCIYEGIWVGPDSPIPNVDGYRTDVLEALKALRIPVLRWPGGCFADEYHWMEGIGPQEGRRKIVNNNWGGTLEDNSFGTHEFLNLCEMLGTEPYISGNVGSGTVEELAKWIEYMTASSGSMAELRARNGRTEPWKVKYLGIGNETWGCGGNMTAQYYSDVYKRYALYSRNYGQNALFKVACGPTDTDFDWTRTMMQNARGQMDGLSLHYYTVKGWSGSKGSATEFTPEEYYRTITKTAAIEDILRQHIEIMNSYDPEGHVALVLDEWGTWFDVEQGSNPGHLYQQNTMRDAMVAAVNLNIFTRFVERLKMANIAQVVNVLQAMVLTDGPQMVLTPTYHVFRMFSVHQNATRVPVEYAPGTLVSDDGRSMDNFSAASSRDASGAIHVTLANPLLDKSVTVEIAFDSLKPGSVSGEILKASKINAYNDFGKAPEVAPKALKGICKCGKTLKVTLPAASVAVLEIK